MRNKTFFLLSVCMTMFPWQGNAGDEQRPRQGINLSELRARIQRTQPQGSGVSADPVPTVPLINSLNSGSLTSPAPTSSAPRRIIRRDPSVISNATPVSNAPLVSSIPPVSGEGGRRIIRRKPVSDSVVGERSSGRRVVRKTVVAPTSYSWSQMRAKLQDSPLLDLGEGFLKNILDTFGVSTKEFWSALKDPASFIQEVKNTAGFSDLGGHTEPYTSWPTDKQNYFSGGSWNIVGVLQDTLSDPTRYNPPGYASVDGDESMKKLTWFQGIFTIMDTWYWSKENNILSDFLNDALAGGGGGDGPCGPGKIRFIAMWRAEQEALVHFRGGRKQDGKDGLEPIINAAVNKLDKVLNQPSGSGVELGSAMPIIFQAVMHQVMLDVLTHGEVAQKSSYSLYLPDIFKVSGGSVARDEVTTGELLCATEGGFPWVSEKILSGSHLFAVFQNIWDQYTEKLTETFGAEAKSRFDALQWGEVDKRKDDISFVYPAPYYGGDNNLWGAVMGDDPSPSYQHSWYSRRQIEITPAVDVRNISFSGITSPNPGGHQATLGSDFKNKLILQLKNSAFHGNYFSGLFGTIDSHPVKVVLSLHYDKGTTGLIRNFSVTRDAEMTRFANATFLSAVAMYFNNRAFVKEQLTDMIRSLKARGVRVNEIPEDPLF